MKHLALNSEYCIYKLNKTTNAYVLVLQQAAKVIRQYVTEYQGLSSVPPNIKVKGILMNGVNAENFNVLSSQLTDIEINQLQFDIN